MSDAHGVRNWLHHAMLAAQAADAAALADGFARAQPLLVEGDAPETLWDSWAGWATFLDEQLGSLRVGDVRLRLHAPLDLHFDADGSRAYVVCELSYRLPRLAQEPTPLRVEATLTQEAGRWVATALRFLRVEGG